MRLVYRMAFLQALQPLQRVDKATKLPVFCSKPRLAKQLDRWRKSLVALKLKYPSALEDNHTSLYPPEWWEAHFNDITLEQLRLQTKLTRQKMHYRNRLATQQQIKAAIIHREEAVDDGKLKRTFDSMLERPQIRWDLDSFIIEQDGEDVELTDPLAIHNAVTANQAQIFTASDSLLRQQGLEKAKLGSLDQWEEVLAHPDRLRELLLPHLPPGHSEAHFTAIVSSFSRPAAANDVEHELLNLTPSYEEFIEAIRRAPRNSSPGPTGLSYSLLKLMSPAVARYVYDLLLNLWSSSTIPEFWKHKFLVTMLSKTQNLLRHWLIFAFSD